MDIQELLKNPDPEVYLNLPHLTLDFETTNLDYGAAINTDNELLLACYSSDQGERSIWGNEYKQEELLGLVESQLFVVAHNAKFELQWLRRMGADLRKILVWDTQIAEYVILGNRKASLKLGDVAKRYGLPGKPAYTDICMNGGVCPSEMPRSLLQGRCEYDIRVTDYVFREQLRICHEEGLLGCVLTRCLLTPVLADIESNGMNLNADRVNEAYETTKLEYDTVQKRLLQLSDGVNFNSPKQVAAYLYDDLGFKELTDRKGDPVRTPTGGRKADADTVSKLGARNKLQREIKQLMLRSGYLNAQLTKALIKMRQCVMANDVLIGQFNQCVTVTHRLSSSGTKYKIQFQNMAREHKPFFKARNEGWLMGEIDGSQLEFRVGAHLGRDGQALFDIRNGVDVHRFTADTLTGAGQETDRQGAKAHTFKPLYGGQSGTKAEKAYYQAFKDKYKGIAKAQQRWIATVVGQKFLRTESGLKFYWPRARMNSSGYCPDSTSICNYPVQSLATAEIIPIAMVYMWHEMKERELQSFMVNTVHDSVILEINPEESDILHEIGIKCFTTDVYKYLKLVYNIDFSAPLGVGIKFGEHWSEGDEVSFQVEPTGEITETT